MIKVQEPVKLFQYNTLGALMAGLYGGTMTVGELLEHGDLGLGTLDSIDGELIVLDGKAYQIFKFPCTMRENIRIFRIEIIYLIGCNITMVIVIIFTKSLLDRKSVV